jgi:hypothetical protein
MKIKICPKCNYEISMDSRNCPHCGDQNKKGHLWGIIFIFVILIIVVSMFSSSNHYNSPSSQPTKLSMIVNPYKLLADYQANEIAADSQYKDQFIEVTGIIDKIGKDILDTPYVTLEAGDTIFNIQCFFKEQDEPALSQLTRGKQITIVGKCNGKMGNILLKECVLN